MDPFPQIVFDRSFETIPFVKINLKKIPISLDEFKIEFQHFSDFFDVRGHLGEFDLDQTVYLLYLLIDEREVNFPF